MQFIEESWKAAFRLLSEGIDSKNMGVKIKNIEIWMASKTSLLNEESSRLFNKIANGAEVLLFPSSEQTTRPSETTSFEEKSTTSRPSLITSPPSSLSPSPNCTDDP